MSLVVFIYRYVLFSTVTEYLLSLLFLIIIIIVIQIIIIIIGLDFKYGSNTNVCSLKII